MNSPARDLTQVQEFVTAAREAQSLVDLRELIEGVLFDLAVDHFLFASHVDFGRPPPGAVAIGKLPQGVGCARPRERELAE